MNTASSHSIRKIGVWLGFPFKLAIRREGISRFTQQLTLHLIKDQNLLVEIWCYQCNLSEYRDLFLNHLPPEHHKNIHFFTEQTFNPIGPTKLVYLANRNSTAEVFILPILTVNDAEKLRFPKVLAFHDFVTQEHRDRFYDYGHDSIDENIQLANEKLCTLNQQGTVFIANSRYVLDHHLKPNLPNIDPERADYCHLPVIPPDHRNSGTKLRPLVRQLDKLPYIFFPSQIRPYKNLELLIAGLNVFRERNSPTKDLRLVMTGSIPDHLRKWVLAFKIESQIIETGDLTEDELYFLHRNAIATVHPSFFEGGLPWQALEAISVGTPALIARTDFSLERLDGLGFSEETIRKFMFEPDSTDQLIETIGYAIESRAALISEQERILDLLNRHDWSKVSSSWKAYLQIAKTTFKVDLMATEAPEELDKLSQFKNSLRGIPIVSFILIYFYQVFMTPIRIAQLVRK